VLGPESKKAIHRKFANTPAGFAQLKEFVENHAPLTECHFCMESTGNYGRGAAVFLVNEGAVVSVENPRFIKHFAIGQRLQNKTDKSDAKAIAFYCRKNTPGPWALEDPQLRELDDLLKRLSDLEKLRVQDANRLENQGLGERARNSIQRTLASLDSETEAITMQIEECLKSLPPIREMVDTLLLEPGVGELTALRFLSHVGWSPETFEDAQQCAAAAGYNPVRQESGKMVGRTRISKQGDARFRGSMYMSTVVAIQHNPKVKAFYEKKIQEGKTKLCALIACCRKLVMILFGILKAKARGNAPVYSANKLRYVDLRGNQKVFRKKNNPQALTI